MARYRFLQVNAKPPRPFCPHCAAREVSIFRASGRGRLYSYVIHHRPVPGFTPPYAIAVVELDEGPRMMTNITDCPQTPEALELDMPVDEVEAIRSRMGPDHFLYFCTRCLRRHAPEAEVWRLRSRGGCGSMRWTPRPRGACEIPPACEQRASAARRLFRRIVSARPERRSTGTFEKLRDMGTEKRKLQARAEDLEATPYDPINADAVLRGGLASLRDLPRLLESGSLEDRKEFVRAFVGAVSVVPGEARLDVQMRTLPLMGASQHSNSTCGLVAGARYEPLQIEMKPLERFLAGLRWAA
jgi:uncharacterized OB-fold protein